MRIMPMISVKATFDPDAAVWYVESSDLPGLNVEAPSIEELRLHVENAVTDLLETSDQDGDFEVPIEIVARAVTLARGKALV